MVRAFRGKAWCALGNTWCALSEGKHGVCFRLVFILSVQMTPPPPRSLEPGWGSLSGCEAALPFPFTVKINTGASVGRPLLHGDQNRDT